MLANVVKVLFVFLACPIKVLLSFPLTYYCRHKLCMAIGEVMEGSRKK